MRTVSLVIALALLSLALLGVLNAGLVLQPGELNLGWRTIEAPLGLVLLAAAGTWLLLAWAAAALAQRRERQDRQAVEHQLTVQRDLADQAEHSRFTELQRHLDLQAQAAEHREKELRQQTGQQLDELRHALQQQLDEVGSSLAAYIGEVEDRLERRRLLRPLEPDRPAAGRH